MTRTQRFCFLIAAWLALTGVSLSGARAQSASEPKAQVPASPKAPTKAAPKPGASQAKTLGGKGVIGGKTLTRDELRQCMSRMDAINASAKEFEPQRKALDEEREVLLKEGDALKAEREQVDRKLAAMRSWEERVRRLEQLVDAYNKKSAAVAGMSRSEREAALTELDAERKTLSDTREALVADESRVVSEYQTAARALNARAEARDAKVTSWNQRNVAINEMSLKLEQVRSTWVSECAGRPYREDDEIAIKKGQ